MCQYLKMNRQAKITNLYADKKTCGVIRAYLTANKLGNICDVNDSDCNNSLILRGNNQEKSYRYPARLGEILDQIYNNIKGSNLIYFGGGSLDINQGVFTNKLDENISLTEKEVAILLFLHKNMGLVTTREELLKTVWGYSENIETHTLETHIYRLRQKIEQDPANPQILVTTDEGYSIL